MTLRSEAQARIRAMVELVKSLPGIAIAPDALDAERWALNCLNGTIDLRLGILCPHRREDYLTRLAPVEFDPAAQSDLLTAFLARILPASALRSFVQRAVGYTCLHSLRDVEPTLPLILRACHG